MNITMASWKVLAWPHQPVCVNLTFSLFLHSSHSDVYKLKELWWGLDGDLKNGRWTTHSVEYLCWLGEQEVRSLQPSPPSQPQLSKGLKKIFKKSLSSHRGKGWSWGSEHLPKLCWQLQATRESVLQDRASLCLATGKLHISTWCMGKQTPTLHRMRTSWPDLAPQSWPVAPDSVQKSLGSSSSGTGKAHRN